jgi:hypothetical protein
VIPNLGNFGQGLPALLGVGLGIRLYTDWRTWLVICIGALALDIALLVIGRSLARRHPVEGGWIIESWILSPILITAFVTALIIWLTARGLPSVFGHDPDTEVQKTLASTFVGAVTAYAAIVWTKDISDGAGIFWPSTQFRAAMKSVQMSLPDARKAPANSVERQAMFSDEVEVHPKVVGWGFNARRRRARLVQLFLGG